MTLATSLAALSGLLVFAGPVLSVASYFSDSLQDLLAQVDDTFWTLMLPASLVALAALLRSPSGLERIWPVLGVILDADSYLRDDHPVAEQVRRRILDRGRLLMQVLETEEATVGARYSQIILIAHSQGTLIAADLLRMRSQKSGGKRMPTSLVTMGSPMRALYAALLPYRMTWFLEAAASRRNPKLGTLHWRNLFFSGDYIGRSLWRSDLAKDTYTEAYEDEHLNVSEICLGPGGHMQYWTSPAVGREILDLLTR